MAEQLSTAVIALPRGILMEDACIIDEQEDIVLTVRVLHKRCSVRVQLLADGRRTAQIRDDTVRGGRWRTPMKFFAQDCKNKVGLTRDEAKRALHGRFPNGSDGDIEAGLNEV